MNTLQFKEQEALRNINISYLFGRFLLYSLNLNPDAHDDVTFTLTKKTIRASSTLTVDSDTHLFVSFPFPYYDGVFFEVCSVLLRQAFNNIDCHDFDNKELPEITKYNLNSIAYLIVFFKSIKNQITDDMQCRIVIKKDSSDYVLNLNIKDGEKETIKDVKFINPDVFNLLDELKNYEFSL